MSADAILIRLRRFLLGLAGFLFAGTLVELAFTGHTQEPVQLIPFVLCGLGLFAVGAALIRPRRKTLLFVRACMSLVALGSLFGMVEHVTNNAEFYLEIHPSATVLETIAAALGGANPLVAPGILAVAAIIAVAATYAHPALKPHLGPSPADDPSTALRSPFDFPFDFAQGVAQGMAQGAVVTREEQRLPVSN